MGSIQGGSDIIEATDRRLQPTWWELERPIYQESYRTRFWPRAAGLAGGILEAIWYEQPELAASGTHSPVIGSPSAVTDTIYVRIGKGALVTIEGLDAAEAPVELEDQRFQAREINIFTVSTNPLDPANRDQALLTSVGLGRGTLFVRADGDPSDAESPVALDLTVEVLAGPATHLVFYWQEQGQKPITLPQSIGTVILPMGRTATLTVEGRDGNEGVVDLSDQLFVGSGTYFTVGVTANPNVVTVTPVGVGPYDPIVFTADSDPGPEDVEIIGIVAVRIVAGVPIATHFGVTSAPVDL